jgi:hypothetical protein
MNITRAVALPTDVVDGLAIALVSPEMKCVSVFQELREVEEFSVARKESCILIVSFACAECSEHYDRH